MQRNGYYFNLRDKLIEHDDPKKIYDDFNSFFDKNLDFPLVSGYEEFDSSNWSLELISPRTESDRLTLLNFKEGFRKFLDVSEDNYESFNGFLNYQGVDRKSSEYFGDGIFFLDIQSKNDRGFSLELKLNKCLPENEGKNSKSNLVYEAFSSVQKSYLTNIMENHLGPNRR